MDEMDRDLMRDQIAATLAAGMMAAQSREWTAQIAADKTREVRALLYPQKANVAPLTEAEIRACVRQQIAEWMHENKKGDLPPTDAW